MRTTGPRHRTCLAAEASVFNEPPLWEKTSPSFNGLAVTSHNAGAVATAVFDDVKLEIQ